MLDQHLEPDCNDREGVMESQRERALKTFAMGLNTNICIDEIATCVAYAYKDNLDDARNLVHNLFLSQADVYAILEDEENYWEAIKDDGYDD